MSELVERWPGYDEQSWAERFAELNRRHDSLFRSFNALHEEAIKALAEKRDRIEALERDLGWQPIETAPKDGARLLLCSNWQYVCLGWWDGNERKEQGWFNALGNRLVQITHWRPLPEPPAIRSGDAV